MTGLRTVSFAGCSNKEADKSKSNELVLFNAKGENEAEFEEMCKAFTAFYCDIYDEAGGIATIATLLAMNSISIKNIGIIHNREFEEGVLRIEFYDEESCVKAQGVLKERNYTLHIR